MAVEARKRTAVSSVKARRVSRSMLVSRRLWGREGPRQHSPESKGVNRIAPWITAVALLAPSQAAAVPPAAIVIYNGLGTVERARVWGRVLEDKGLEVPGKGERWWGKLKRSYQAFESDEIPHARLELKILDRRISVKADGEGLFQADLEGPLPTGSHRVRAALKGGGSFRVIEGQLRVWPRGPGVAVVSDIDDTILRTGVGDKLKMIKRVALSSAEDLKSFDHAPALYQAWARSGAPIVFVSGSPINLYSRLARFMALKGLPAAPMLLKNLGTTEGADALRDQVRYKLRRIEEVCRLLPGYHLVLIGDSGERDPEIYAEIRRRKGRAVRRILIHKVTEEDPRSARFRGQILFSSYLQLARRLREIGILGVAELKAIRARP
jgi:phosphatidate phosphatase APP1